MFLVFLTILTSVDAWAQRTIVSGTVVCGETGNVIASASVTAAGVAVVTNDDGLFTLKTDTAVEVVTVSHVGYRSRRVSLKDGQLENLTVKLVPTSVQLSEVLVMADNPRELVMAAIRKIPQNYSRQPQLYNCFYRETAMKRQHYICVSEGVVDMYKTSYQQGTGRDRVAIRKGRRLLSPKRNDTLSVKVMGGPVASVQLDLVKNTDFLLNADDLDCYDLKMETPTSIGDRQQFVAEGDDGLRPLFRQAVY